MNNLSILKKNNLSLKYHIYALIIFSFYYLLSLALFDEVIIKIHDNLDNLVVYDHIISRIINGEIDSYKSFLSGEFKWFYLDRIFYPLNLLHLIFNDKTFYFFFEILKMFSGYLSFYLFSKFFLKEKENAFFSSILYVTIIHLSSAGYSPTIFLSAMPYLLYLILYKTNLNIKHYTVIIFIGLNSSLVFDYLGFILILFFCFFLKQKKNNYQNYFIVLFIISITMVIVSTPTILVIFDEPIHRVEFIKKEFLFLFKQEIKSLFYLFLDKNLFNFFLGPLNVLKILVFISFLFLNNKKIYYFTFFILSVFILKNIFSSLFINEFFDFFSFLKGFNFSRIANINPFLLSVLAGLILTFTKNLYYKKFLKVLILLSCLILQFYLPITEYVKEFFKINLKENSLNEIKVNYDKKNYKNILIKMSEPNIFNSDKIIFKLKARSSFDGYYKFDQYKIIKNIVGEKRVASLGIDPMIAPMNDINVIDGYYTIYPLSYKIKFRTIIQDELKQNKYLKDYYDNWGSRLYLFYTDKNNLLINFEEVKKLGAEYIITSFQIQNKNLEFVYLIDDKISKIYLYKLA